MRKKPSSDANSFLRLRSGFYGLLVAVDIYLQITCTGGAVVNRGVSLGLLPGIGVGMVGLLFFCLAVWVSRNWRTLDPLEREGAILTLMGAMGNLLVRIIKGGVVDYIGLGVVTVNIADIMVTTGVGFFAVTMINQKRRSGC